MPQSSTLDSIELPELTDSRRTSHEVHAHLRRLIIEGTIPPGTVLKQAPLARRFRVSRTPMREAFRRLQEEDLILADPNQRAIVRAMDGEELDQLYSARIALESLGARLTTGRLEHAEVEEAQHCLREMATEDWDKWVVFHGRFHEICAARAGQPLLKVIQSYAERSQRYTRLYWTWHPSDQQHAQEHHTILEALQGDDPAYSGVLMAQHLSHTAVTILNDVSVGVPGISIQEALAMATGKKSPINK